MQQNLDYYQEDQILEEGMERSRAKIYTKIHKTSAKAKKISPKPLNTN